MSAQTDKIQLVERLVAASLGNELRRILLGASRFNRLELEDQPDAAYPEAWAQAAGGLHMMTQVLAHLEFTSEFGIGLQTAIRNGKHHFSHPEEYETWLMHGAPGVSIAQLHALESASKR